MKIRNRLRRLDLVGALLAGLALVSLALVVAICLIAAVGLIATAGFRRFRRIRHVRRLTRCLHFLGIAGYTLVRELGSQKFRVSPGDEKEVIAIVEARLRRVTGLTLPDQQNAVLRSALFGQLIGQHVSFFVTLSEVDANVIVIALHPNHSFCKELGSSAFVDDSRVQSPRFMTMKTLENISKRHVPGFLVNNLHKLSFTF